MDPDRNCMQNRDIGRAGAFTATRFGTLSFFLLDKKACLLVQQEDMSSCSTARHVAISRYLSLFCHYLPLFVAILSLFCRYFVAICRYLDAILSLFVAIFIICRYLPLFLSKIGSPEWKYNNVPSLAESVGSVADLAARLRKKHVIM